MIILDSSFLIASLNTRDDLHAKAVALNQDIKSGKFGEALIPIEVIIEVSTYIARKLGNLNQARDYVNFLASNYKVVFCDWEVFEKSRLLYCHSNESLSLVDCIIINHAKKLHSTVASFDSKLLEKL